MGYNTRYTLEVAVAPGHPAILALHGVRRLDVAHARRIGGGLRQGLGIDQRDVGGRHITCNQQCRHAEPDRTGAANQNRRNRRC